MSLANSLSQAGKMNELAPRILRSRVEFEALFCATEGSADERKTRKGSPASAARCLFTSECMTVRGLRVFFMLLTWLPELDLSLV